MRPVIGVDIVSKRDMDRISASIFDAQGFRVDVEHNVRWNSVDTIIDGLSNIGNRVSNILLPSNPIVEEEDYVTVDEGNMDDKENINHTNPILEFLGSDNLHLSLLMVSLIMYELRRTKLTTSVYFIFLSIYMLKRIMNVGEESSVFTKFLPLWDYLSKSLASDENGIDDQNILEPQSGMDFMSEHSALLTAIINGVVGYKPKKALIDALLQMSRTNDTQCKNINTTILWIAGKLHVFFSDVCKLEKFATYFEVQQHTNVEVNDFISRVENFVSLVTAGHPANYAYCLDVYTTYISEGQKLCSKLDKNSVENKLITRALFKLHDLRSTLKGFQMSLSGDRIEPVGVLFKGDSGVFKSVLMSRVGHIVAQFTIPKEWKEDFKNNPKDFHYCLPPDQFYDRYTNKAWIAYADDLFQKRDIVGTQDSEPEKIIKLINTAPFPLKMADVSQKNNTFFRSAFVLGTTNLNDFSQLQSVVNAEAVRRRFAVEVHVSLNSKYTTNGKIDINKLPNVTTNIDDLEVEGSSLPNDLWDLRVTTKKANTTSEDQSLTIPQLIKIIITKHHENIKNFYINKNTTDNMLDELTMAMEEHFGDTAKLSEACFNTITQQSGLAYQEDENDNKIRVFNDWLDNVYDSKMRLVGITSMVSYFTPRMLYGLCRLPPQEFLRQFYINNIELLDLNELDDKGVTLLATAMQTVAYRIAHNQNGFTGEQIGPIVNDNSHIKTAIKRCKDFISKCYNFIKNNIMYLFVGSLITGPLIYYLSKLLKTAVDPVAQSVDFSRLGHRPGVKTKINLADKAKLIIKQAHGFYCNDLDFERLPKVTSIDFGEQNTNNDIISKIVNKSLFIMYLVKPGDDNGEQKVIRLGHALNVRSNLFIIPLHFVFQLYKTLKSPNYTGAQVVLTTSTVSNRYVMHLDDFLGGFRTSEIASNNDICLVEVKVAQTSSQGIYPYLLKQDDFKRLKTNTSFASNIIGTYLKNDQSTQLILRINGTRASFLNDPIVVRAPWESEESAYQLTSTITYKANFNNGDCGSLLCVDSNTFQSRIIAGFHVAGDGTYGFSSMLSQEFVNDLIEVTFPDLNTIVLEEEPPYIKSHDLKLPHSSMEPIGTLTTDFTPGEVIKSDITASKVHNKLSPPNDKCRTLPARLKKFTRNGVEVDPLHLALNRYGKKPKVIPLAFIDEAAKSYFHLINLHSESLQSARQVIGTREALHSFDNVNGISSSTSAGFPMTVKGQVNLKKEYFAAIYKNDMEEATRVYLRIAEEVEKCEKMYFSKIRPFWAYKDCLKDETIAYEKAMAGKTRMFSGSPFILLVMFRKYFGAFINDFTKANINVGSAVGVNPYSRQWDSLARHLCKFSDNKEAVDKGAGDFSAYDTTEFPCILNKIIDIINTWYGKGNDLDNYIRLCLWAEITNSRHIARNQVYEWFSGLPSGNPMTAIINTMYNNLIFRIAFQFANLDINLFNKLVYLCALGDDNIFSVHESIAKQFNEMKLPELMSKCGMKYTTELKAEASVPARKLQDVEFLKRSFKFDEVNNRWVAPLREEVFADMLNWTKKEDRGDQITVDNMVMVLREASLHGEEKFYYWLNEILQLKNKYLQFIEPHSELEINYENAYRNTCNLEYYF